MYQLDKVVWLIFATDLEDSFLSPWGPWSPWSFGLGDKSNRLRPWAHFYLNLLTAFVHRTLSLSCVLQIHLVLNSLIDHFLSMHQLHGTVYLPDHFASIHQPVLTVHNTMAVTDVVSQTSFSRKMKKLPVHQISSYRDYHSIYQPSKQCTTRTLNFYGLRF